MTRLIEALTRRIHGCRRKHTNRSREHRCFIRQDIAEQVTSHNDIKFAWSANQLHGSIVDIHVGKRNVWVVFRYLDHRITPQLRRFEYVCLVDSA